MATMDNLKEAFAGESQANRRYLAFAKKADEEGKTQVARLFRAAAEAETVHANVHLRLMGAVKSTADNLQAAIQGEHYEATQMYPKFQTEAGAEGNKQAATLFGFITEVESIHDGLYNDAIKAIKAGKDMPAAKIFVCGVCGNTVLNGAPDVCPVCGSPKSVFAEIK